MLISWITNTIDPEVRSSISKFREARFLWEHLKKRYAQTNGPRIQQLKSSIAKCEQNRDISISVYYGKLHSVWQELDHHKPLISCSCCTNCVAGLLEVRREQSKLHDFLMGLYSDFYAPLRSNILSQDPLPSLDRAYQLVVQDERVRAATPKQVHRRYEALGFAFRTVAPRSYDSSDRGQASLIDELNYIIQFNSYICVIQDQTKELIGTGARRDELYYFSNSESVHHVDIGEASSTLKLWHRRVGHPSKKVVKLLPHVSSNKDYLDKGYKVFDDYSRAVWMYLLVDKTEVLRMFLAFVAMVDRKFSQTIKIMQSNNGTEFNCLHDYFVASGILFQTSCVGTPQQNGRVERKHKHILNVGGALRFEANLPIYFWGECILAPAHLINRTPTPLLQNKTPFEILFNKPPSFDAIRTFGCLCFAHNQKTNGDKFVSRSRKCVFVGYPFRKKGWKVYDLESKVYFVSCDVKFVEGVFPFDAPNDVNIESTSYDNGEIHEDFSECVVFYENVVNYNDGEVACDDALVVVDDPVAADHDPAEPVAAKPRQTANEQPAPSLADSSAATPWQPSINRRGAAEGPVFPPQAASPTATPRQPATDRRGARRGLPHSGNNSKSSPTPTLRPWINVLVYVDDLIVSGNDSAALTVFKAYLGLLGAKPSGFPIEQNHKLSLASGALLVNPESYCRLVGRLIYLSGWCDSDWEAGPLTRRSLTGWIVFLGKSPISWKTKKQPTVATSSSEAEYRCMSSTTHELKWLKALLLSMGVQHPKAIKLFCDNQSTIHIARNPVFHERTKHIDINCHIVRDAIIEGLIAPSYVSTKEQLADIFTKALGKTQFDHLLSKLCIYDPHAPT
ncbi:uncharacterized protein LOC110721148 [Chenopodium quinoa]|uniref:uncharacterized protein LOC110721148 n=1 Tax=Chenopodium quinoa TaxID=63459 RepID=UPI000B7801D1|nr:uncharacterized protein LOC110721148 [Chenopodium quinoa]